MLLSACMIVKNEERTIEKCLTSLKGVADEVIVVDTGSADLTPDIARNNGALVVPFTWDDDFSHARNESLRYAKGDWILVIDADEYLDETKKAGLRPFLEQTDAEGIFVIQKNYLGSLTHIRKAMPIRVMRIFRRGHQYSGSIHEQVADSVQRTGKPVAFFDLDLHHIGYTDEFVKQRNKSGRNTALLTSSLEEDPSNLFHRSNLIAEYVITRQFTEAAKLAEETFKEISRKPKDIWPNFTPRILLHWVASLWEIGQPEKALEVCAENINHFPWLTDLKKLYADMLVSKYRYLEAEQILMECREQGDTKDGLIEVTEGSGTYFAALQLGVVWSWLGDDMVARQWYLQAFFENPTLEFTMLPILSLMPPDEQLLTEHLETKLVDAITAGNFAEMYAIRGISGADALIRRIEGKFGPSEMTLRAKMTLLRREGTDVLATYVDTQPYELAHFLFGLHLLDIGDIEHAHASLERGGTRGQYIWKVYELLTNTRESRFGINMVARDMVAMHTENLLREWLPHTVDLHEAWIYLKYSPLGCLLEEHPWPGDTIQECEQNALRAFRNKQFAEASNWLIQAEKFGHTVTQVLLACDLALAGNEIPRARQIVFDGKKRFPRSQAIKHASEQIHPKVDPVSLSRQLSKNQGRSVLQ